MVEPRLIPSAAVLLVGLSCAPHRNVSVGGGDPVKSPPRATTATGEHPTMAPPRSDLAGAPDAGTSNGIATEADASAPEPPPLIAQPTAAARDVVVYDPSAKPSPRVKLLVARDKLPRAEKKRILDRLFGTRYLTDDKQCTYNAQGDLEASRKAGDFVPHPFQVAQSAFTEARASQKLYVVANGECGASHAENFGSVTLAVFAGDTVVARANTWGGSAIQDFIDLDGDGKQEIVLSTGYSGMGSSEQSLKLVRFEGTDLVTVKDFEQIYEDDCGAFGDKVKTREYSIIHAIVRPGAPIEFRSEPRRDICR